MPHSGYAEVTETQRNLFAVPTGRDGSRHTDRPPARPGHATQQAGADAAWPRAGTQERRILEVLREDGPLTRREIAGLTHIEINAVCGRVDALLRRGLVRETGGTRVSSLGVKGKLVDIAKAPDRLRQEQKGD